jgi:hypothetical protein
LSFRIIAAYVVLLVLGIPWYWPPDQVRLYLGFPLWAVVSLCVGLLASALTAWLFLRAPLDAPDRGKEREH